MKKSIIVIIFVVYPLLINAQLSGNGTYADPWHGTLDGDATWSGLNYINGDITVDNEKLTISAGAIIIFLSESADLIITVTGQLEADGTPENMIRFTADDDNDGNYGESGERWGHVSFQSMGSAGASLINYCIIEFGYKTGSGIEGYGGGIHADFNNITISNTIIQNNYAQWGGGIFVNKNRNPSINNCYVYNNQSLHGGGGTYFWNGSSSSIINCIFDSNQCLEASISYYTGGGLAAQSGCLINVINCTFVNNTSSRPEGQSIILHNSDNSRIINSIFWGSPEKQIYCYGTTASIIINCAYRGITYSTGTPVNPFILNSSNAAVDGPNFTATDGSDWSIKFISPCRDIGVNSYTGVTIPSTDYEGNSRISTKDIGTYEVQYSRWTGTSSTDWATATNWDASVDPSSGTGDVIIPTGLTTYPVGSTTQDFTLGSGKQFIIEQGAKVTLNNLTNNGIIKLNESASGFASLIINSYSRGTGATEEIQLYLTGGGSALYEDYKWHYISTPVSSLSTDVFTGVTFDLAQFVESRPSTSLMQGWVAFDGYVYSTGQSNGPTFSSLTPGKGYNFWDGSNNTFLLGGLLNTSDAVMSLGYSGLPTMSGFNLLGNPFTSGLDWNDIANSVYFTYPSNTSKGLYFTRDNLQCTYIGGVGIPGDVTGIIPPMQGFFTKTYSTGNSITLPAAARTHDNIHSRYKGDAVIPLVRLMLKRNNMTTDETVIRFDALAKSDLDNDFDAVKMFISTSMTQIYSSMGGVDYAINGQPFPDNILEIPIVINLTKDTIHTISVTQLQGLDDFQYVYLRDNSTGFATNLKTTPVVTFSGGPGTINNRFVLSFTKTGIETPNILNNLFNIYSANSMINIQTISDEWDGMKGSVKLLDITGKTVTTKHEAEFSKNSLLEISAPSVKGLYIVELKSGLKRFVGKVVIK